MTESGATLATSPSAVTIAAGATSATLTVGTADDGADEPDSVVTATVRDGSGYTVGAPREATVTVTDDDDPAAPDQPVADDGDGDDGSDGETPTTVTVSLAGVTPSPVPEGSSLQIVLAIDGAPSRKQRGRVYALDIVENVGVPAGATTTHLGSVGFAFDASQTTLEIHPPLVVPEH